MRKEDKMKKIIPFVLVVLTIIFGCKDGTIKSHNSEVHISGNKSLERLLQKAIDNKSVEPYINLGLNQSNFKLYFVKVDTLGVDESIHLTKYDRRILMVDLPQITKDSIEYYFRLSNLNLAEKEAHLELLYYPKQLLLEADYKLVGENWSEQSATISIVD